jgi:hypothetical protein
MYVTGASFLPSTPKLGPYGPPTVGRQEPLKPGLYGPPTVERQARGQIRRSIGVWEGPFAWQAP